MKQLTVQALYDAARSFDQAGATYHEPEIDEIRLSPRSSRSFTVNDSLSLEAWLIQQRYIAERTRSGVELARLRKRDRLVILYHSGSVLCQGDDWEGAVKELQRFVVEGTR